MAKQKNHGKQGGRGGGGGGGSGRRTRSLVDLYMTSRKPVAKRASDPHFYRQPLKAFHMQSNFPLLYQPYECITGANEVPAVALENQGASLRHPSVNAVMMSVQKHTQQCIEDEDARINGSTRSETDGFPTRLVVNRQLKFGMRHDGSHGDNAARKVKSVQVARSYLELCGATAALRFIDELHEQRLCEIDDLCDALNLALSTAREIYSQAYRTIEPRYNFKKAGARMPSGTVRVYAVDPGTRNYARCLIEVDELCAPRSTVSVPSRTNSSNSINDGGSGDSGNGTTATTTATVATSNGATSSSSLLSSDEPNHVYGGALPSFRILHWELLDFKRGCATALFAEPPRATASPTFYRPIMRDIVTMFNSTTSDKDARMRRRRRTPRSKKRRKTGDGDSSETPVAMIDLTTQ